MAGDLLKLLRRGDFLERVGLLEQFFALGFFGGEGVGAELEEGIPFLGGEAADAGEMVEPENGRRRRAKSVFELILDVIDLFERGNFTKALVDFKTEGCFSKVALGKFGIVGEFHFGFMERGIFLVLKRIDGAFEEFAIEMEANRGDVP